MIKKIFINKVEEMRATIKNLQESSDLYLAATTRAVVDGEPNANDLIMAATEFSRDAHSISKCMNDINDIVEGTLKESEKNASN